MLALCKTAKGVHSYSRAKVCKILVNELRRDWIKKCLPYERACSSKQDLERLWTIQWLKKIWTFKEDQDWEMVLKIGVTWLKMHMTFDVGVLLSKSKWKKTFRLRWHKKTLVFTMITALGVTS